MGGERCQWRCCQRQRQADVALAAAWIAPPLHCHDPKAEGENKGPQTPTRGCRHRYRPSGRWTGAADPYITLVSAVSVVPVSSTYTSVHAHMPWRLKNAQLCLALRQPLMAGHVRFRVVWCVSGTKQPHHLPAACGDGCSAESVRSVGPDRKLVCCSSESD